MEQRSTNLENEKVKRVWGAKQSLVVNADGDVEGSVQKFLGNLLFVSLGWNEGFESSSVRVRGGL